MSWFNWITTPPKIEEPPKFIRPPLKPTTARRNVFYANVDKQKVVDYIKQIYRFLGDKYCFVSGGFVIQDDDNALLQLLHPLDDKILKYPLQSHTAFKNTKEEDMFEIHVPSKEYNLTSSCKCADGTVTERPVQNIKWYPFIDNDKKFIYLKLEDHPTIDIGHAIQAISRYGLGQSNTSCVDTRREDCEKDKSGCKYKTDELTPTRTYETITIDGVVCSSDETYTRKGDEFFIPCCVNNYLLDNVNREIQFVVTDNNISMSISSGVEPIVVEPIVVQPSVGGRKSKKNKKMNKKTKKNKRANKKTKKQN